MMLIGSSIFILTSIKVNAGELEQILMMRIPSTGDLDFEMYNCGIWMEYITVDDDITSFTDVTLAA